MVLFETNILAFISWTDVSMDRVFHLFWGYFLFILMVENQFCLESYGLNERECIEKINDMAMRILSPSRPYKDSEFRMSYHS